MVAIVMKRRGGLKRQTNGFLERDIIRSGEEVGLGLNREQSILIPLATSFPALFYFVVAQTSNFSFLYIFFFELL